MEEHFRAFHAFTLPPRVLASADQTASSTPRPLSSPFTIDEILEPPQKKATTMSANNDDNHASKQTTTTDGGPAMKKKKQHSESRITLGATTATTTAAATATTTAAATATATNKEATVSKQTTSDVEPPKKKKEQKQSGSSPLNKFKLDGTLGRYWSEIEGRRRSTTTKPDKRSHVKTRTRKADDYRNALLDLDVDPNSMPKILSCNKRLSELLTQRGNNVQPTTSTLTSMLGSRRTYVAVSPSGVENSRGRTTRVLKTPSRRAKAGDVAPPTARRPKKKFEGADDASQTYDHSDGDETDGDVEEQPTPNKLGNRFETQTGVGTATAATRMTSSMPASPQMPRTTTTTTTSSWPMSSTNSVLGIIDPLAVAVQMSKSVASAPHLEPVSELARWLTANNPDPKARFDFLDRFVKFERRRQEIELRQTFIAASESDKKLYMQHFRD